MVWGLKKNIHPDYWMAYASHFEKKKKHELNGSRFVVLDTETTGFDYNLDRLLCIGAITVTHNEISVSEAFEIYIKQEHFNPKTVEIHGLIHHTKIKTVNEEDAIIKFLDYIKDAILVAHHATFDIKMINIALSRLGLPKLKNQVMDTRDLFSSTRIKTNFSNQDKMYSLDEIAEEYNIDCSDRHTAAGDALITALIFLKTINSLNKSKPVKLESFFLSSNRF